MYNPIRQRLNFLKMITAGRHRGVFVTIFIIVTIGLHKVASQNFSTELNNNGVHNLSLDGFVQDLNSNELMNHLAAYSKMQMNVSCNHHTSIYECHIRSPSKGTKANKMSFSSSLKHTNKTTNGCIQKTENCHVREKGLAIEMDTLCKIIRCLSTEIPLDLNARVDQVWKNLQHDISMNCKLTHCDFHQEDTQKINVKEVHTKEQAILQDCTNAVDSISQTKKMTNSKNYYEKRDPSTLTIVTGGKLNRTVTVHIPFNQIPILIQLWEEVKFQKKCKLPQDMLKRSSYLEQTKSLQNVSPFKGVHFPYMSHLLIGRKRHTVPSWKPWRKVKLNSPSRTKAAANTQENLRHKREMHIMLARYRKEEIQGSRKTKPKTSTPKPSNKGDNSLNVEPFSILNVSFTGSWEPPPKTTVKPRVGRPLKMTPEDMEFVHEKKPKKERKQQNTGLKIVLETGG